MNSALDPSTANERALRETSDLRREQMGNGAWWHSIQLGEGKASAGVIPLRQLQIDFDELGMPKDLAGKRLIDIGCWDGFYSFESERRGAEVLAVEPMNYRNFLHAREALNSRAQFLRASVYELRAKDLGTFDHVLFLGVLYHLRHPLLALERVCELTRGEALIRSHVCDHELGDARAAMEFFESDELGGSLDNWWAPNTKGLMAMCRSAGFAHVEVLQRKNSWVTIRAQRRPPVEVQGQPSLRILSYAKAWFHPTGFPSIDEARWVTLHVEGIPESGQFRDILVRVGEFWTSANLATTEGSTTTVVAMIPPGIIEGRFEVQVLHGKSLSDSVQVRIQNGDLEP